LGTGHAAKVVAESLENLGHAGNVLVSMGDKYLEESAIDALVGGYVKQRADMALLTVPENNAADGSTDRVFVDTDGQALDIIEKTHRRRQAIVDELQAKLAKGGELSGPALSKVIDKHIPDVRKQQAAVAELLALAKSASGVDRTGLAEILDSDRYNIQVAGRRYSARQIEKVAQGANPSLYLFAAEAFYRGVASIANDNAQGQYYLTDVVRLLAGARDSGGRRKYRVRAVPVDNPDCIWGFNSPDELLAIQDHVRRKKLDGPSASADAARPKLKSSQYCTVRRWLARIQRRKPSMNRWLASIYGHHDELHAQKCRDLKRLLECYGKRFGWDQKVCIVRAPGRINLMGRHVDHRGGMTNFLAIAHETLAAVGLREDNDVLAVNTEPKKFKPLRFNVSELIGRFAWSDWINFVDSDWVREMTYRAAGEWGNYIKAAMLRLQHGYQDVKVRGVNMALSGDVPIAAGLSSSSTIVVATLQAAIALNNFELTSRQFIDLCGEGEWFVGSRGGAGDHAAIYLGQRGKIAHVGYLPFRVEKIIDAPEEYQVIVANSHIKAAKSSTAKDQFNARIAGYNLGLALLKQRSPEIAPMVEYVRDLDPVKLGCATSDIYRMLLKVPQFMTRKDFRNMLSSEHRALMDVNFSSHGEPECYTPRGVLLYGAAEILRSKLCVEYLESGRLDLFGALMKVSHDGDRVSRPGADGKYRPIQDASTDDYLHGLIADLASEDPQRVRRAQLPMQPGSYACSTPEIDQMADVAAAVPGVAGAQIAGAGLGGCIMVLARKESVEEVRKALVKHYYRPAGLKPAVIPCIGVEGAGLVEFS
jgi:N-acetylgalactosamine kinase